MTEVKIYLLHHIIDKIKELIPEHYREASSRREYKEVDIDFDYYMALSAQGDCYIVTIENEEGIQGYSIYTVGNDPIRKDVIEASNTCLYVKKALRGIGTKKLIDGANNYMKKLGASRVNYLVSDEALIRLLGKMGFNEEERLMGYSL